MFSFGASSAAQGSPGLFGAAASSSAPSAFSFGAAASTASPSFSFTPQTTTALQLTGPQASPGTFQLGAQAAASAAPSLPPLTTADGRPASGETRWEELSEASKRWLLGVEERLMAERTESAALEASLAAARGATRRGVADDARALRQQTEGARLALSSDAAALGALEARVRALLHGAESAVRLAGRVRAWHDLRENREHAAPLPPQAIEDLRLRHPLPSPGLAGAVRWFEESVRECRGYLESVEGALRASGGAGGLGVSPDQVARDLPRLVEAVHDQLVAAAARVEKVDARVGVLREAHKARMRQRGRDEDPFASYEGYEHRAPQVHPSRILATTPARATTTAQAPAAGTPLALPAPTTSSGGLFGASASAAAPASAAAGAGGWSFGASSSGGGLFGASSSAAATGGGLFGATSGAAASGGGLFGATSGGATTTGGLFGAGASSAAASGGFSFGAATPGAGSGGAATSGGLFGGAGASTPTSSAGLFGATSSAAAGGGGGLFGASTGAAAGGGGLFGATSGGAAASGGGGLFGAGASSAAASGGFSFGGSTPAASSGSGGFSFGAPAQSSGGFAFGR